MIYFFVSLFLTQKSQPRWMCYSLINSVQSTVFQYCSLASAQPISVQKDQGSHSCCHVQYWTWLQMKYQSYASRRAVITLPHHLRHHKHSSYFVIVAVVKHIKWFCSPHLAAITSALWFIQSLYFKFSTFYILLCFYLFATDTCRVFQILEMSIFVSGNAVFCSAPGEEVLALVSTQLTECLTASKLQFCYTCPLQQRTCIICVC